MYYLYLVVLIFCIWHAVTRGADWWWFLVIFFLGPLGMVLYVFLVALPDLRARGSLEIPLPESWKLRAAENRAQEEDTWDAKADLAEIYARSGRYKEAISLLEPALNSAHKKNPYMLYALAFSYLENGEAEKCLEFLECIDESERREKQPERHLLRARSCHVLERLEEAAHFYELSLQRFDGEEARLRSALFFKEQNQDDRAKELLEDVVRNGAKAQRKYRRDEAGWIRLAKEQLHDWERQDAEQHD